MNKRFAVPLEGIRLGDAARVGYKAAVLGDLLRLGLQVPPGFCITASALEAFLQMHVESPRRHADLESVILKAPLPAKVEGEIRRAYRALARRPEGGWTAVRLSGLEPAAGQGDWSQPQHAALAMCGWDEVLSAVRRCWASAFSPRALRRWPGGTWFEPSPPAVVVQAMVNAACAGVAFSCRQRGGRAVMVEACWGLGQTLTRGMSLPDRYYLTVAPTAQPRLRRVWRGSKGTVATYLPAIPGARSAGRGQYLPLALPGLPAFNAEVLNLEGNNLALFRTPEALRRAECLSRGHLEELAGTVLALEDYYREPQSVEWAVGICGTSQGLFILQAQPEAPPAEDKASSQQSLPGMTVAGGVARGRALVIHGPSTAEVPTGGQAGAEGGVLVAPSLSPELIPLMLKARAVVTESGGTLSHAAILAREMGIPCLTGVRGATRQFLTGDHLEVDGANGRVRRLQPAADPRVRPELWAGTRQATSR
ncbi:MAG: hypothetical protein K6T75_04405 [Acetobacteraceae bacterium]|nr:hypothetical protein [Acetobacteraceae bacterium]